MNILVTGGAGYIGSHAAYEFKKAGHNVIVLDNLSTGHIRFADNYRFYRGDINSHAILDCIFSNHKIDAVSHFAGSALVGESINNPALYYENNINNAVTFLNYIIKKGVKFFQFSSSCSVYGNTDKKLINEATPLNPINPYAQTKKLFEDILKYYSENYKLNTSILRYFNAAGSNSITGEEHDPETHLIPLICRSAIDNDYEVIIFGTDYNTKDGTCIRDYVHVSDIAMAHLATLEEIVNTKTNTVYNVGSGVGYSVKEVINFLSQITSKKVLYKEGERRKGDPDTLVSDISKISKIWTPKYSLSDVLDTAVLYYMANCSIY
jgi:UDP-glucose 4-epimerase